MGRKINRRIIFEGALIIETALHIGSGESSVETDALCIRDSDGFLIIPGSSLAGAFRSQIENLLGGVFQHYPDKMDCGCLLCNLFGNAEKGASKLIFDDAYLKSNSVTKTDIRDGVGIRRDTQTTREGAKYDLETVPPGSIFSFHMSVDLSSRDDKYEEATKKILIAGLEEFRAGRIPIGADSTRGLGTCNLEIHKIFTLDFRDTECLIPFLKNSDLSSIPPRFVKTYEHYVKGVELSFDGKLQPLTMLELDFDLILDDPDDLLVIKSGSYPFGESPDIFFVRTSFLTTNGIEEVEFIPGSSLKGLFRNRAEQILRTLVSNADRNRVSCDPTERGGCGKCTPCMLFGYSKGDGGLRGRIIFEDAYKCNDISNKKFDFVAINRFTGGALQKAKFNAEIATRGKFKSRITLKNPQPYEIALIAHLFKDLYLKDLPIGFGKYKGFGWIKGIIKEARFLWIGPEPPLVKLAQKYLGLEKSGLWTVAKVSRLYLDIVKELDEAFKKWVEAGCKIEAKPEED